MKTNEMTKVSNWKGSSFFALSVIVLAAIVGTACGKKGDDPSSSSSNYYNPYGVNCSGVTCLNGSNNGSQIATAVGRSYSGGQLKAELALQFVGDPAVMQQLVGVGGYGGYTGLNGLVGSYTGQIQAQGVLNVYLNDMPASCPIPTGQYQVRSTAVGQWSGQSFAVALQGTGPTQLQISLPNNFVSEAIPAITLAQGGGNFPYKIQNTMVVIPQTGYGCSGYGPYWPLE